MKSVLTPTHWWITVAGLGLVFVFVWFAAMPEWYQVDAPALHRCFGFDASFNVVRVNGQDLNALTITRVDADSPLARAGVRAGDVPMGYQHGQANGFYSDLGSAADGGDVTFRVVAPSDVGRAGASRSIRLANVARRCR